MAAPVAIGVVDALVSNTCRMRMAIGTCRSTRQLSGPALGTNACHCFSDGRLFYALRNLPKLPPNCRLNLLYCAFIQLEGISK